MAFEFEVLNLLSFRFVRRLFSKVIFFSMVLLLHEVDMRQNRPLTNVAASESIVSILIPNLKIDRQKLTESLFSHR